MTLLELEDILKAFRNAGASDDARVEVSVDNSAGDNCYASDGLWLAYSATGGEHVLITNEGQVDQN